MSYIPFVERCDIVFRVPDPKGVVSRGAEAECRHARTPGIPVVTSEVELRRAVREVRNDDGRCH